MKRSREIYGFNGDMASAARFSRQLKQDSAHQQDLLNQPNLIEAVSAWVYSWLYSSPDREKDTEQEQLSADVMQHTADTTHITEGSATGLTLLGVDNNQYVQHVYIPVQQLQNRHSIHDIASRIQAGQVSPIRWLGLFTSQSEANSLAVWARAPMEHGVEPLLAIMSQDVGQAVNEHLSDNDDSFGSISSAEAEGIIENTMLLVSRLNSPFKLKHAAVEALDQSPIGVEDIHALEQQADAHKDKPIAAASVVTETKRKPVVKKEGVHRVSKHALQVMVDGLKQNLEHAEVLLHAVGIIVKSNDFQRYDQKRLELKTLIDHIDSNMNKYRIALQKPEHQLSAEDKQMAHKLMLLQQGMRELARTANAQRNAVPVVAAAVPSVRVYKKHPKLQKSTGVKKPEMQAHVAPVIMPQDEPAVLSEAIASETACVAAHMVDEAIEVSAAVEDEPMVKEKTRAELNQERIDEDMMKFHEIIHKINALQSMASLSKTHKQAVATLAEALDKEAMAFWKTPCDARFMVLNESVKKLIATAEQAFATEPGVWRNYVQPLVNAMIHCLNGVMAYVSLPQSYQVSMFRTEPTALATAWDQSKIKSQLLGEEWSSKDDAEGLLGKIGSRFDPQ